MRNRKRYVDVISPSLRYEQNVPAQNHEKFENILHFMNGIEFRYSPDKIFELILLQTNIPNCVVGMIVTTQDRDIPPKRDKLTKAYTRVNINPDTEGLAYANVFIYDNRRKIFIYEINRNGCFPNQLIEFVNKKWNEIVGNIPFDLKFKAVLRANEYERMLGMNYYKKITVELFNPIELVNCFDDENDSVENNLLKYQVQAGNNANADSLKLEQVAMNKRLNPMGLSRSMVKGLVDVVNLGLVDKGFRKNIHKLEVEGYSMEPENARPGLKQIDLLADTFNEFFKIPDIQIQSDVQEVARKAGIEDMYNRLLAELKILTGIN